MAMILKTCKSTKDISILNTYAPHMGYSKAVLKDYWGNTNAYVSLIPRKYTKIWRTGNNGQVWSNEENKFHICKWTLGWKR